MEKRHTAGIDLWQSFTNTYILKYSHTRSNWGDNLTIDSGYSYVTFLLQK